MQRIEALTILNLDDEASDRQIIQAYEGKTLAIQRAFAQQEVMPDVAADPQLRDQLAVKFYQIQQRLDVIFSSLGIATDDLDSSAFTNTEDIPLVLAQEEKLSTEFDQLLSDLTSDAIESDLNEAAQQRPETEAVSLSPASVKAQSQEEGEQAITAEDSDQLESIAVSNDNIAEHNATFASDDDFTDVDESDRLQTNSLSDSEEIEEPVTQSSLPRLITIVFVILFVLGLAIAAGLYSGKLQPLLRQFDIPEIQFTSIVGVTDKKQQNMNIKQIAGSSRTST